MTIRKLVIQSDGKGVAPLVLIDHSVLVAAASGSSEDAPQARFSEDCERVLRCCGQGWIKGVISPGGLTRSWRALAAVATGEGNALPEVVTYDEGIAERLAGLTSAVGVLQTGRTSVEEATRLWKATAGGASIETCVEAGSLLTARDEGVVYVATASARFDEIALNEPRLVVAKPSDLTSRFTEKGAPILFSKSDRNFDMEGVSD